MLRYLAVAALIVASSASAFGQSGQMGSGKSGSTAGSSAAAGPSPSGNLNNPQAQANQAGQPSNARTSPSAGDAASIPTPVVKGHPMTGVPKQPGVPK